MRTNVIYNCDNVGGAICNIEDGSVDLVLTDPPYNASNSNIGFDDGYKTIDEEWDKNFNPKDFLDVIYPKLRDGGSMLIFCTRHLLGYYIHEYPKTNSRCKVQDVLHWEHITAFPAIAKVYTPCIEYIVWYSTPKYTFNLDQFSEKHSRKNVIRNHKAHVADDTTEIDHPSIKPTDLLRKLLRIHSNIGDSVVDMFMGSGSLAVACIEEKRNFIGFELDNKHYNTSKKRVNDLVNSNNAAPELFK